MDDSPDSRLSTALLLQSEGYRVREAGTGAEGLALAREADLVVLDVRLPDLDGREVGRRLKADPATAFTPVILLSGVYTGAEDKAAGLEGGADAYLTKPAEPRQFLWQIKALLRVRRMELALRASEERYRHLFDCIPDPLFVYDRETLRYLAVNDAAVASHGYSRAELSGMTIADIRPPEDVPRLLDMLARSPGGLESRGEWRHCRKDGSVLDVEITAHDLTLDGRPACIAVARDVTDRKRAAEALRVSEERYRHLADAMPQIVWVTRADGYQEYYNRRWYEYTGLTPEQTLGEGWPLAVHPDDRVRTLDAWRRVLASGEPFETEYRCRRHDGAYRWFLGRALPQRDDLGRVVRWFGTGTDIEDQKRVHRQAAESLALLETVLGNAPVGFALIDPELRYAQCNEALAAMNGVPAAAHLGRTVAEVVPGLWPHLERCYHQVLATGAALVDTEVSGPTAAEPGRVRHWVISYYPVRVGGTVLGIGVIVTDATARREADEALRASEERFRTLVAATAAIVWNSPASGAFDTDQPGWTAFTGQTVEQHRGWGWLDAVHPDDREESARAWAAAVAGGRAHAIEHRLRRADGEYRWMSARAVPVRGGDGAIREWVGVHTDVTDRRQLEEQFRQAQKMEAIGRLAGGVAHDFNNILTVINGYSQLLADRLQPGDPDREMLAEIGRAGERAAGLTRQLLAFSRQTVLEPRVLDPNALVRGIDKLLRRLIGEDVELATILAPDVGRVKADPGQLEQALVNLVVNARDAMPGGGRLTVETANAEFAGSDAPLSPEVRPGRYVQLAVSDTRQGMDAATMARVFEPFFSTKGPGQGTGLGLAMVFGFVKQSGGHVAVLSEPGRGAVFNLYLPRVDEPTTTGKSHPGRAAPPTGTETVLLVEDEDGVRALSGLALRQAGYAVLEATNGRAAVRAADEHPGPIRLLVTDVVMPEMSGPQVAEAVRRRHPGAAVLFTSGYTDDAVVRAGVRSAEVAFLQKPFSPAALATKVREVLDAPPGANR